jgi:hypothetical protein
MVAATAAQGGVEAASAFPDLPVSSFLVLALRLAAAKTHAYVPEDNERRETPHVRVATLNAEA